MSSERINWPEVIFITGIALTLVISAAVPMFSVFAVSGDDRADWPSKEVTPAEYAQVEAMAKEVPEVRLHYEASLSDGVVTGEEYREMAKLYFELSTIDR